MSLINEQEETNNQKELAKLNDRVKSDQPLAKRIVVGMIIIILISIIGQVLYSSFKSDKPRSKPKVPQLTGSSFAPVSESLGGLSSSAMEVFELHSIQSEIDSLLAKDQLSSSDSTKLLHALKRLENINQK